MYPVRAIESHSHMLALQKNRIHLVYLICRPGTEAQVADGSRCSIVIEDLPLTPISTGRTVVPTAKRVQIVIVLTTERAALD